MSFEAVKFTVLGEPTGKARPRVTRFGVHTPEKTVCYENLIKIGYPGELLEGNIYLKLVAYYGIPKSASRKKRGMMLSGELRPTKKPDCDNVLKIYADALNGIAYRDDAQIVSAGIDKFYDDTPRVEVEIRRI